jgi:hypothetical protein
VTISVSGSYKLSGNLTIPDANTDGIIITANDVTIDLNGFSIIGPTVCSRSPTVISCIPTGSGRGIANTFTLSGSLIGLSVMWCTATNNFGDGIDLDRGGVGINNVARGNRGDGIASAGSITFSGNTATDNGGHGISVNCPSAVIGNTASGNSGGDISAGSGCTRANNAPTP